MKVTTPAWIAAQPTTTKVLGTTVVVLGLAVAIITWRWRAAQAESARLALERSNAIARATPSRELTERELSALRNIVKEEISGATRPVVQEVQRNDAADRALHQERIAMAALTATVASLIAHQTSTAAVVSSANDSLRTASFDVRQVPYTLHADVAMPRPPAQGTLDATVTIDPAHLWPRIGCSARLNANGIREARYTIAGPDWLNIIIDSTSQDPAVCNPSLAAKRSPFRPRIAIGPGASLQLDPATNQLRAGWSVNVSVSLWTCDVGLNLLHGRCQ